MNYWAPFFNDILFSPWLWRNWFLPIQKLAVDSHPQLLLLLGFHPNLLCHVHHYEQFFKHLFPHCPSLAGLSYFAHQKTEPSFSIVSSSILVYLYILIWSNLSNWLLSSNLLQMYLKQSSHHNALHFFDFAIFTASSISRNIGSKKVSFLHKLQHTSIL